jgi:hypothetical protein
VIEGYLRRRAWSAFFAGYGMHAKDAKIEHLLGKGKGPAQPASSGPMTDEAMAQNIRRWRIATTRKVQPERQPDGQ